MVLLELLSTTDPDQHSFAVLCTLFVHSERPGTFIGVGLSPYWHLWGQLSAVGACDAQFGYHIPAHNEFRID